MSDAILKMTWGMWRRPWVRRGIALFVLCLCSCLAVYWLKPLAQSKTTEKHPAPKLELPQCPVWLGKGAPGDLLTATVPVWNTGEAPLHIEKLEATCECSSLSISEKVIAPGEKADLHVGARLPSNATTLSFGIQIVSDAPQSPTTYEVGAEIEEIVRLEPLVLNFGTVPMGREVTREIRVYPPTGKTWLPQEKLVVGSKYGLIQAELVEPDEENAPSTVKKVIVKVRADAPSGSFLDRLMICPSYTDRTAEMVVRGCIVPAILASPSVLYFNEGKTKPEFRKRRFVLRRSAGKPIGRVASAEAPEGVDVIEDNPTGETGNVYNRVCAVRLKPESRGGEKARAITITIEGVKTPVCIRIVFANEQAR